MADHGVHVRFLSSGDAFGDGGRYQACILIQTSSARMLIENLGRIHARRKYRIEDLDDAALMGGMRQQARPSIQLREQEMLPVEKSR